MNKRIFELLKQATTDINPQDREWVFSRVDQVKFAELIVEACAQHVLNDTDRHRKEYFADLVKTTFWDK